MKLLYWILFLILPLWAQNDRLDFLAGNQFYEKGEYEKAAEFYQNISDTSLSALAAFNEANAWFRQEKYEKARDLFQKAIAQTKDSTLQADALHNIGNSYVKEQKLQESLEYFKKALEKVPNFPPALYNYNAVKKLLDQNKNQDQKQNQNKNQNQDQKQNKDAQNQNDPQNQDQNQKADKQDQKQAQIGDLSKEDVEKLLDAFEQQNKNVQPASDAKKKTNGQQKQGKDW